MTKALCRLEDAPQYNIYKCWFYFFCSLGEGTKAETMLGYGLTNMLLATGIHESVRYRLKMKVDLSEWRGIVGSA